VFFDSEAVLDEALAAIGRPIAIALSTSAPTRTHPERSARIKSVVMADPF
jgi:hypothetical protein